MRAQRFSLLSLARTQWPAGRPAEPADRRLQLVMVVAVSLNEMTRLGAGETMAASNVGDLHATHRRVSQRIA